MVQVCLLVLLLITAISGLFAVFFRGTNFFDANAGTFSWGTLVIILLVGFALYRMGRPSPHRSKDDDAEGGAWADRIQLPKSDQPSSNEHGKPKGG